MWLGWTYRKLGEFDDAQETLDNAVSACKRLLGDNNPINVAAEGSLSRILNDRQREAKGY